MTDFLKQYGIQLAILIVAVIILFQTCNQEKQGNVIIFPDSIDKAIDKKLDSLLNMKTILEESNPKIIQKKYYYETQSYLNIADTSFKRYKCMQFARELLR